MLDAQTRDKIRALYQEIDALYKESVARPSGHVCDICGAGDTLGKNGYLYKVRSPIHGYTHRESVSPTLCWRHASGWAHSYTKYDGVIKRTGEEIDLHFARFLAHNLNKVAKQQAAKAIGEQK
jgi:hypothetical protein